MIHILYIYIHVHIFIHNSICWYMSYMSVYHSHSSHLSGTSGSPWGRVRWTSSWPWDVSFHRTNTSVAWVSMWVGKVASCRSRSISLITIRSLGFILVDFSWCLLILVDFSQLTLTWIVLWWCFSPIDTNSESWVHLDRLLSASFVDFASKFVGRWGCFLGSLTNLIYLNIMLCHRCPFPIGWLINRGVCLPL